MTGAPRYAVTLPGPFGSHSPPHIVIAEFTGSHTAAGAPVYGDTRTGLRVEIHAGAARVLDPGSHPAPPTCLHAVPVGRARPPTGPPRGA
ncbi:DUF6296 family protein [Kitasatospora sp. NPDC048365]|uniref:DUF6296 family protein n=1 Tax=Kitasatospora sp. NPDC048365 TaxID=3364050 RepID=UPI00371C3E45